MGGNEAFVEKVIENFIITSYNALRPCPIQCASPYHHVPAAGNAESN